MDEGDVINGPGCRGDQLRDVFARLLLILEGRVEFEGWGALEAV